MNASDARAKRITTTGALSLGRARLGAVLVTVGSGSGRLTLTDGVGGPVLVDMDFNGPDTYHLSVPGDGVLFTVDPAVSTATLVTAATLFFM